MMMMISEEYVLMKQELRGIILSRRNAQVVGDVDRMMEGAVQQKMTVGDVQVW